MNAWTPEQRLADIHSLGIDVQVVSTNVAFYKYDQDVATTTAIARECNDEVRQMTVDYPERFAGLATLPMQDIPAIAPPVWQSRPPAMGLVQRPQKLV